MRKQRRVFPSPWKSSEITADRLDA